MADEPNAEILASMTLSRLYELAREHSIKNPRKYKKQELIGLIVDAQGEALPVAETGLDGGIHYGGQILSRDESIYQTDQFTPQSPFEVASTGFVRSQRVAVLRFQPFQYNPVTGELRIAQRIRVQLDFVRGDGAIVGSNFRGVDEGDFETTLRQSLLNYETARDWRTRPVSISASWGPSN